MSGKALEIKLDIPFGLPIPPAEAPSVKRKPLPEAGFYSKSKALAELKEALSYIPSEFHEQLAPEFLEEYKKYGHIYGFRFRPGEKIKAKPLSEYRGNCLEGRVIQMLLDSALETDKALCPYEMVSSEGKAPVCRSWMQYELLKKYLSIVTEELTLVIEKGRPVGLFKASPDEPRIVITDYDNDSYGSSWLPGGNEITAFALYTAIEKTAESEKISYRIICSEYAESLEEQIKAAEALGLPLIIISQQSTPSALSTSSAVTAFRKAAEGKKGSVIFTGEPSVLYEYILTQCKEAEGMISLTGTEVSFCKSGTEEKTKLLQPGSFISDYFISEGFTPFSWYCLSGSENDIKVTTKAVRDCIDPYRGEQAYSALRWLRREYCSDGIVPGRSILIDEETAMLAVSKLNDMVRNGETGPLLVTDCASRLLRSTGKAEEKEEKELLRFAGSCSGGAGIAILTRGKAASAQSGLILDGSEKTDRIIKAVISRSSLNSFITGVWGGKASSCQKAQAFNKKRSDGHIAIPFATDEEALKQLLH